MRSWSCCRTRVARGVIVRSTPLCSSSWLSTPPRFSEARDPLEADDWIAEIKKHFNANTVRPADYVTFASFQLQGAAASWYDTYKANKGNAVITWTDFVT